MAQRIDIGFVGGQVLSAKVEDDALPGLRSALDAGGGGWHNLESEDGQIAVDLAKVAYVRVDAGVHKVGFSSGS